MIVDCDVKRPTGDVSREVETTRLEGLDRCRPWKRWRLVRPSEDVCRSRVEDELLCGRYSTHRSHLLWPPTVIGMPPRSTHYRRRCLHICRASSGGEVGRLPGDRFWLSSRRTVGIRSTVEMGSRSKAIQTGGCCLRLGGCIRHVHVMTSAQSDGAECSGAEVRTAPGV